MLLSTFIQSASILRNQLVLPSRAFRQFYSSLFAEIGGEAKLLSSLVNFAVQTLAASSKFDPKHSQYLFVGPDSSSLFPASLRCVPETIQAFITSTRKSDSWGKLLKDNRSDECKTATPISLEKAERGAFALIIVEGYDGSVSLSPLLSRFGQILIIDTYEVLVKAQKSSEFSSFAEGNVKAFLNSSVLLLRKEIPPDICEALT